jgi:hypothetical protein
MTEAENPISRWSRLKLAAQKARKIKPAACGPSPHAAETGAAVETEAAAASPGSDASFDPASLPPIDSIAAGTDIRAFLQSGVPAALARDALRRAWVSEPGIRDFIGIAENQWDFTDPTAIPGFGPLLETDDLPRLVAQALGTFDKSSVAFEDATVPAEEALPATYGAQCGTVDTAAQQTDTSGPAQIDKAGMAVTDESPPVESRRQNRRRPHGSALPQ